MAEKNVEELEDMRCQQAAQIEELQRSLNEKNQMIETLNAQVNKLEVQRSSAELSSRNTTSQSPSKPVPMVGIVYSMCNVIELICMYLATYDQCVC